MDIRSLSRRRRSFAASSMRFRMRSVRGTRPESLPRFAGFLASMAMKMAMSKLTLVRCSAMSAIASFVTILEQCPIFM